MKINKTNPSYSTPNFKSNTFLNAKMKPFMAEAHNLAKMNVPLEQNLLKSFIRCFSKDVKLVFNPNLKDQFAYLDEDVSYSPILRKSVVTSSALNLNPELFSNNQEKEKIFNLGLIIHEMTHFFEHDRLNPDCLYNNIDNFLNKNLSSNKSSLLSYSSQIWQLFERTLTSILAMNLKIDLYSPKEMKHFDNCFLDYPFLVSTGLSIKNFIKENFCKEIDISNYSSSDREFVYDYILNRAQDEFDAYTFQTDFQKDELGIKGFVDIEYRNQLYKEMIDTFEANK